MVVLQIPILGSSALFISLMLVAVMVIAAYFRQFALGVLGSYTVVGYIVVISQISPYVTIMYSFIVLTSVASAFQIYGFFTGGGV